MISLAEKIRQLREAKDMSLRELGKKVDASPAFLSDVELGRRYPSDKLFVSLAVALDISLKELKACDTRLPLKDLRRITISDPSYGFAFRQIIDKKISPEELIKFVEKADQKKTKGK